jgi:hypothetical protein
VPRFKDNVYMKAVRLSDLRTGRSYPSGNILGTHFCERLSRPQGDYTCGTCFSAEVTSPLACYNEQQYLIEH